MWYHTNAKSRTFHGGVKVSTGVWKLGKRAEVGLVFVKKDPLNINAKRNNRFAAVAA